MGIRGYETQNYKKTFEHPNVDVFYNNTYDYDHDEVYHDVTVFVQFDDMKYRITEGGSDRYEDSMLNFIFDKTIESGADGKDCMLPVYVEAGEDSPEKRQKLVECLQDYKDKFLVDKEVVREDILESSNFESDETKPFFLGDDDYDFGF